MTNKFKVIQRNKRWVSGATVTESCKDVNGQPIRRFTATIRGFQNWKIYEGPIIDDLAIMIIEVVREIRNRIDRNDETVFEQANEYLDHKTIGAK